MNKSPLVMCLTNAVASEFTANALLAIGAKPAMVSEPEEAAELAAKADAVLVNLGTVDVRQAAAMRAAVAALAGCGTPWTLDPVGCQLLAFRRALAEEFLAAKPTLVRGNHAEIDFLKGTVPELMRPLTTLSTGEIDRLGDGREIRGGVPMLQTVTATGCIQGALAAALLGRGLPAPDAAEAVSRLMKSAGELAWSRARTPGSFRTALVDALWELRDFRP